MAVRRYSGLSELPGISPQPEAVPPLADPREARRWVQSLPRADGEQTRRHLGQMLETLLAVPMSSRRRLRVLEELRIPTLETIAFLERDFVGAGLPLPPSRALAAADAERLHLLLAHGYRLAAAESCTVDGRPPLFGAATVACCLERALCHYAAALREAWRVYRQPALGLWQGLHRSYWFAESIGLGDRAVHDAQEGGEVSIRGQYLRTLLLALANPYAFSQVEQGEVARIAIAFGQHCRLSHTPIDGPSAPVPEDADLPPGLDQRQDQDSHTGAWLDIAPLVILLDAALAGETDQGGWIDLSPQPEVTVRIGRETLCRLRRALGQAAARGHRRMSAGHRVDAVVGMSGLHYHLAGELDFDSFVRRCVGSSGCEERAAWAAAAGENGPVPLVSARVEDQSLGGYLLSWPSELPVRARVGELMGISFPADQDDPRVWMIAFIRWLRTTADGRMAAGVELMARRAWPLAVRSFGPDGKLRPLIRAIELDRRDGTGRPCFVVADGMEADESRVELLRAPDRDDPDRDEPDLDQSDLDQPVLGQPNLNAADDTADRNRRIMAAAYLSHAGKADTRMGQTPGSIVLVDLRSMARSGGYQIVCGTPAERDASITALRS